MTESDSQSGASLAAEGKDLYRDKQFMPAAESFGQAAAAYQTQAAPLLAAEMRNNQAVALLMANQPRQALEAVTGTSQVFLEAGDHTKGAMALANQAAALKDLGEREEAIEFFSRAAVSFQAAGEEDMYLQTMQSISSLKMKGRDVVGALFSMQSGLEGLKAPTWRQKLLKNLLAVPNKLLPK